MKTPRDVRITKQDLAWKLTKIPTFLLVKQSAICQFIWHGQDRLVRSKEVLEFVRRGDVSAVPNEEMPSDAPMDYHLRRIAYLVRNFPEDSIGIEVDFSGPVIWDGNHRLCAALIRREPTIHISASGYLDFMLKNLAQERTLWKKSIQVTRQILQAVKQEQGLDKPPDTTALF